MSMTISTFVVEHGHSHSGRTGILGTVGPFWSQLLAVPKWASIDPRGNSTAGDPPTIVPKAPKDGYRGMLTEGLFVTQNPEAS